MKFDFKKIVSLRFRLFAIVKWKELISDLLLSTLIHAANGKRRRTRPSSTVSDIHEARHTMRYYYALPRCAVKSPIVAYTSELWCSRVLSSGLCTRARFHLPARVTTHIHRPSKLRYADLVPASKKKQVTWNFHPPGARPALP